MASSVKHSALTNEQYTPAPILEMVREVLGSIDLDPATSALANETVLAKEFITLEDGPEETFHRKWQGNVFLNPPGGQGMVIQGTGFQSNPSLFWAKMMHAWHVEKTMRAGIFLGFTLEVLQSSQCVEKYPMLRFPFCVPSRRLSFDVPRLERIQQLEKQFRKAEPDSKKSEQLEKKLAELAASDAALVPGDQPPHANVIVLVPPLDEHQFGDFVPLEDPEEPERPWVGWTGPVTRRFWDVFSKLGYVRT